MRAVLDQSTLSNEERLLLLGSRIQLNEKEEELMRDVLKDGIDVPKLIGLASRHKVLQLMTPHLIRLDDEKNHDNLQIFTSLSLYRESPKKYGEIQGIKASFTNISKSKAESSPSQRSHFNASCLQRLWTPNDVRH